MVKGQGVVYINYVDDKMSSGMNGHAVNIFFHVYDFDIDKRSKSAYIDIRNGDYSKITLIPLRNIDHKDFTFEKVTKIERKWDHDILGHRILIHTIHKNAGLVWGGIDAIYVFDESDVKSLIIGRTGMKDIKVNVNGGKYDNDR